jgi:ATP-dependent helicase/nuclease subunit B
VLDRFFKEMHAIGRPAVDEAWTHADRERLLAMLDDALADARERGLAGLPIYAEHDARTIRADLIRFLDVDTVFRQRTHAVPSDFEQDIPEQQVAGVTLRGRVDRIDRRGDEHAWVIDYKTGKAQDVERFEQDPFDEGRRLQLPTYISAAHKAREVTAMYWFITQKGGFLEANYKPTPELNARFQRTIEAIISGVRSGAFPAVPGEDNEYYDAFENCGWCDFNRICSRRRDAESAAKREDPAMQPWQAVADAAAPSEEAP